EPAALIADPVERRLQLLFGLDTAAEVGAKAHRGDALPIDGAAQLRDGGAKARVTHLALGAKLRNREAPRVLRPASFEGRRQLPLLLFPDVSPAGILDQPIQGTRVCRYPRFEGFVVAPFVLGLDSSRMLLDRR